MKTLLKTLRFFVSLTIKLLIAGLLMALLFVLGTTRGARLALDLANRASHGAIRCEEVTGRLLGHINLKNFTYEDENVRVDVAQARAALMLPTLLIGRVQVRDLEAGEVRVAVKDTPPSDTPYLTHLPFALIVDHGTVELLRLQATAHSDWLDFHKLELSAAWFDDVLHIENAATDFLNLGRLQAQGQLRFMPDGIRIENTRLSGPGQFTINLNIGYDNRFELNTQWQEFHFPFTGKPTLNSTGGEARAAGTWEAYDYWLSGDLQTQGIKFPARAEGQGNLDALTVKKFTTQILGGTLSTSGRVQWTPQILIEADGNAAKINPALQWKDWPGELNGRFHLATKITRDVPEIQFNAELKDSRLRGYPFSAQAAGHWHDPALQLDDLLVRSGESRLHARGQALPPFDLAAQLDSPDLAQLWPALHGSAALKGQIRGPMDGLAITLHGQASQLAYEKFSAKKISIDADLDARSASSLDIQGSGIEAGRPVRSVHLQGSGTAEQHTFKLQAAADNGTLTMQAAGALDVKNLVWTGALTQGEIAPRNVGAWTLEERAALSISRSDITLAPACWHSDDSRACAQIHRSGKSDTGIAFRLDNFSLSYFRSFLPKGWSLLGKISGTGDLLARELNSMRLDVHTTEGSLSRGDRKVLQFLPGVLVLAPDNNALVAKLQLPLTIGGIDMNARLAPGDDFTQRALSGSIKLNVPDLEWLRLLTPEIESVAGRLQGELQLTGTSSTPGFKGAVELLEGRMKLATPGIELSPLRLKISGSSDASLVLNADATSGGGTLHMEGTLDNSQPKLALKLSLNGESFQAMNTPEARIWISPTLQLLLSGRNIKVGGAIKVPKAQITPTTFATGVAPSSDQIILTPHEDAPPESPWLMTTEIRLELGEDVHFDGFGLKTQLTGAIVASDEPGKQTTGNGEIALQGGHYKAYGQDLNIETGRLLFNGGPITRPAVQLRATRKPTEEITVGVYVRGTLDAPEFSLYSSPAMPQERQLSWLVLGRSMDEQNGSADRNQVSSAALSLGLTGGDYIAQKIGNRVGLDTVTVGARPGQTTDQAQLTLGKYLSPKLFVSYGVGLFQRGYSVRLLYDIGRGFKLQSETGVESGGDLLYSIER